ncbi:DUF421 domain-containing protein [Sphingopyxis sp. PAMC25046]|uniref:DUF421 domain-containing protein n=1 Tax=Sphingopyxis sp. PAMC25046 TaxID=2565556 RepID=UPI00109DB846|nr:YetF domain-containing protein [Sphingopyxis sp. PAMC25046]QCB55721.1 DUF421 domain-containing protein [Sphingopyxis sp. PAMC25046]
MLGGSWDDIGRVLFMGVTAYFALVLFLRVSGNRTLAKFSAFDLVVTVALGSTLATILLSRDVSLAEGVAAFAILILLQFLIAKLSVRTSIVERLVRADARVLLIDGILDTEALRRERITREDIMSAIRSAGLGDVEAVAAVVLETDGSLSVIAKDRAITRSALPGQRDRT